MIINQLIKILLFYFSAYHTTLVQQDKRQLRSACIGRSSNPHLPIFTPPILILVKIPLLFLLFQHFSNILYHIYVYLIEPTLDPWVFSTLFTLQHKKWELYIEELGNKAKNMKLKYIQQRSDHKLILHKHYSYKKDDNKCNLE